MRKLALAAMLMLGCSRSPSSELGFHDAGALSTGDRLSSVRRLAAADATWSAILGAAGLQREAGSFESRGFGEALGGVPMAFGARAPLFGDGRLEVRSGEALIALRVLDARPSQGVLVDGDALYEQVHESTDFVVAAAGTRVETFWSLRDEQAPRRFRLALETKGLTARAEDGGLSFVDAAGDARVRMPRPSALDARGVRRAASLALEGDVVTIALDTEGLTYPVLLDPALEQVQWTNLGPVLPTSAGTGTSSEPRVTFPSGLPRASATMRAGNGRVYLFGGASVAASGSTSNVRFANTRLFEWSGSAWSDAAATFADPAINAASTSVTDDRWCDFVWDGARSRIVMFGGVTRFGTTIRLGVYELDPSTKTWTKVCADDTTCASGAPTVTDVPAPPAAVFAFGKAIVVTDQGTFEWDPVAKVYKRFAATPDLKRAGAALAFDPSRNKLVAYGNNAGASDTWETDGVTWKQILTTGPTSAKNASLTYQAPRKSVLLWGSDSSASGLWRWNGATWSAVTLTGSAPTARPNAAFTYDDTKGKLLMFGGGTLGPGCYNSFLVPADLNSDLRTCARVDTWSSVLFGGACASSAECGPALACVDGVCCQSAACGSCQRCDVAGSVGTCTTITNAEDDTCSGTRACNATGGCTLKLAQPCALGTECVSGNCVDGVCCNNSCPGSCESCNQAGSVGTCSVSPAGSSGKGACGAYTCSGTSGACATACATDGDCASNAYCSGGKCVPQVLKGGVCTRVRQCATGACSDGVCCDSTCSGTCDVCSKALGATADGTCTLLPSTSAPAACAPGRCSGLTASCTTACGGDGDCASGAYCNAGACTSLRAKGDSCDRTAQCAAGLTCADGVCCNAACDGACQACAALNKQSGDKSGECGPAREGTNPRALCAKSAVTSCGLSGLCGSTGSCAVYAAGTPCGPTGSTSCVGDLVKGQTCDGIGACVLEAAGIACSPARCVAGSCKTSCVTDADCAADGFCAFGTCKKRQALGAACGVDRECASGLCADGRCCNARCDGSCEACDLVGAEGTCSPVKGKPRLGHPACPSGDASNPCSASSCDGVARASCDGRAGPDVECRKGSCDGDVETLAARCDGKGGCPAAETRACLSFACGDAACRTTCSNDTECQHGFVCGPGGACVAVDKCVGSVITRVNGAVEDCAPYVCESSGRCKKSCATTADCVSPRICNESACVNPTDPTVDSGGGCALGRPGADLDGGASGFAAVSIAALLLALGRRRSAR